MRSEACNWNILVPIRHEHFHVGRESVAENHIDQFVAGESWNARRSYQVDPNERRRTRKRDCLEVGVSEMEAVVRWSVVLNEGGEAVGTDSAKKGKLVEG